MNKCEKCGFLHYRTDPCRKPKVRIGTTSPDRLSTPKSDVSASPPRKEVHTQSDTSVALASNDRVHDPAAIQLTVQPKARVASGRVGQDTSTAKFDKKAWMRDYMREHRRGIRRRAAK